MGRSGALAAALAGAGLVGAAVIAGLTGTPAADAAALVAFAALGSLAAVGVAVALGRAGRGRSLRARLAVAAVVSAAATVSGVVLAARAMFISSHDLGALLVIVAAAAGLAGAAAVVMAGRVADEVAALAGLARSLGDGSAADAPSASLAVDGAIASVELAAVADELQGSHDRLVRARRRERALDESRRELVAWVSHDLRSPISSVRAMAEALEDGVVTDEETVGRYHHAIRAEAERLGTLVDDLFELSRITSGLVASTEVELVPLDELLVEVVDGARGPATARHVALAHRLADDGDPPMVPADLRRVLRNLVDNAVSATADGGRVVVSGRRDVRAITLDVTDECGGIDEHHLPRLFEVGYRADPARARDGGGGLGLAIARGLLEAHDGRISVTNDGPGCRFTVVLPPEGPA
jgi:signal transduction histidine kinase